MSLDKETLLNELTTTCAQLQIPHHHIHISHGGAAVINEIRKTTGDIDVSILSVKTWERLLKANVGEFIRYEPLGLSVGADAIRVGNIDFHWMDEIDITVDVHNVDGFWVSTNEQILIERIKLGRDKDKDEAMYLMSWGYGDPLPAHIYQRLTHLGWEK